MQTFPWRRSRPGGVESGTGNQTAWLRDPCREILVLCGVEAFVLAPDCAVRIGANGKDVRRVQVRQFPTISVKAYQIGFGDQQKPGFSSEEEIECPIEGIMPTGDLGQIYS
ncbi:MAG TPA: hypothetical protein VJX67_26180 [Blastocatellia bacterium]|nr:hypothetical protein [Blastocatellia bacterium]